MITLSDSDQISRSPATNVLCTLLARLLSDLGMSLLYFSLLAKSIVVASFDIFAEWLSNIGIHEYHKHRILYGII